MIDTNELQALKMSAVLYDAPRFELVKVTGKDRVSFLHRVTTGKIEGVPIGGGTPTLLLDVRSHVLFALYALIEESCVHLVVSAGGAANLAQALAKYAIMDECQFDPISDEGVLSILGPRAALTLAGLGVAVPPVLLSGAPFSHLRVEHPSLGPLWLAQVHELGNTGIWILAGKEVRAQVGQALARQGLTNLSPESAEFLRIMAMEPRPGNEITGDRFPVEIGLGRALDHTKGCYVGQETIVRMRDRGTCRRRLVLLRLQVEDGCTKGDILDAPGRVTAGQITSVGTIPGENGAALALLASSVPTGTTVKIHHKDQLIDAEVVSELRPWG